MVYYTITTPFFQIFGVLIPCHSRITLINLLNEQVSIEAKNESISYFR